VPFMRISGGSPDKSRRNLLLVKKTLG